MTFYSFISVTPTTEEWVADYVKNASPLVGKHGGKYLSRTTSHERIEGEGEPVGLRVLLEWPTKEAAENFMKDPEYAPYLKARTDGAKNEHILFEGKDDLA